MSAAALHALRLRWRCAGSLVVPTTCLQALQSSCTCALPLLRTTRALCPCNPGCPAALLGVAAFVGGKWWGRRAGGWKKAPLEGQSKVSEAEMGTIKPTDTSGSNAAAYQPPQAPGAQPAAHAQGGMESVSYDRRP